MRAALLLLAAASLSGCLNWHEGYAVSARRECQKEVNDVDRRACLDRVEEVAQRERREDRDD